MTLQPLGSAGHRRAPAESCCWLNPPRAPRRRGSSCSKPWAGAAGPAGSLPGSQEQDRAGGQDPSAQLPPALPGSACFVRRLEASGFPRPHAQLSRRRGLRQAPGSGRVVAPKGQHAPTAALGTACSQLCGSRDFSLSHGEARGTHRPRELSAVSFLAGSMGKTGESGGSAPGRMLLIITSQGRQVSAGTASGAGPVRTAQHQAGGSCLPAPSTFAGTRDQGRSPRPAGASPALDILLFGG